MKNIRMFLSENFHFFVVKKLSIFEKVCFRYGRYTGNATVTKHCLPKAQKTKKGEKGNK